MFGKDSYQEFGCQFRLQAASLWNFSTGKFKLVGTEFQRKETFFKKLIAICPFLW